MMIKILKCISFVFLLSIIVTNCEYRSEGVESFYVDQNNINQWINYLEDLGFERRRNRSIVLFARSADCKKYENEINWWAENISDLNDTEIVLVILEKYGGYYESIVSALDVQIPTYQDDNFDALYKEMIPIVPSKIFIDYNNKRIVVGKMGTSQSIISFLEKASN
jgi:hypothetical protein